MIALIKRNLLVYTRDRIAFVLSFLSIIILLVLYQIFIGKGQMEAIQQSVPNQELRDQAVQMVNFWLIAGLTTVATLTSTLGAFGVMIIDRENKIDEDFMISSYSPWKFELSYALSAILLGTCISLICCFLGILIFNGTHAFALFTIFDFLKIFFTITLSCILSASMTLPLLLFIKSGSAFSTLSTIIGTFIGFISGIYIPIGTVGTPLSQIMTWFPLTQVNAMLKQELMTSSIKEVFGTASSSEKITYSESYGITLKTLGGHVLSFDNMLLYVIVFTFVVIILHFALKKRLLNGKA